MSKKIKILAFFTLSFTFSGILFAQVSVGDALAYATINSAVATSSAIVLQKAGFQTQTFNTPYGLVTTVQSSSSMSSGQTQSVQSSLWEKQQEVSNQRQAFMAK